MTCCVGMTSDLAPLGQVCPQIIEVLIKHEGLVAIAHFQWTTLWEWGWPVCLHVTAHLVRHTTLRTSENQRSFEKHTHIILLIGSRCVLPLSFVLKHLKFGNTVEVDYKSPFTCVYVVWFCSYSNRTKIIKWISFLVHLA